MKALQIESFGAPADVVRLVDVPDVGAPGAGEVVIAVEASPINMSDLLMISGNYGVRPKLPAFVGAEGVGRVVAVGADVTHLKPGDRTLVPYPAPAWSERVKVDAGRLRALPAGDVNQLAMIGINPPTAYLMLTEYVTLPKGAWVIQNASNSGVGRALIPIAKSLGLKTVNVVRRADLVDEIKAIGGDVVLVDGPDLPQRVAEATDNAPIRLAVDGVGDTATANLVSCLAEGGLALIYSAMSGKPFVGPSRQMIFRDISLRGFWLVNWFKAAKPETITAMYERLVPLVASGAISAPVAETFSLDQASQAMKATASNNGKVLFRIG